MYAVDTFDTDVDTFDKDYKDDGDKVTPEYKQASGNCDTNSSDLNLPFNGCLRESDKGLDFAF